MKISKAELACIAVTLILVGFAFGYYARGATIRDAIVIETEKAAPSETVKSVQAPTPEEVPAVSEEVPSAATEETPAEEAPMPSAEPDEPAEAAAEAPGLININTATAEELDALPGIGPVLAERIVAFRAEYGAFAAKDELMLVSGIGEKIFGNLENLITVEE